MRVALVALLIASAATLAGCSSKPAEATETPADSFPSLHGWIVDAAIRPLKGVTVKVIDTNTSTVTNAEGYYGFADLPYEQFLVVVATLTAYTPSSKQISLTEDLPTRLNFSLELAPVKLAATDVREFNGILACQAEVSVNEDPTHQDCGSSLEQRDTWQFTVGPDLAGAVIEVNWRAQNPGAESLGARLETLELGKLNLVLGEVVGPSPLRIQVPQAIAEKYYVSGGLMRLTVHAQSNGDEVEAGLGASVAVQQVFSAYATMCYVVPPHPAYSFVKGSPDCTKSP